jgi:hypothetical protein
MPRKVFNTSDNGANGNVKGSRARYLQFPTGDINHQNSELCDQLSAADIVHGLTFVQRLRDIAARRASLLQQLNELQEEEQEILASLASFVPSSKHSDRSSQLDKTSQCPAAH